MKIAATQQTIATGFLIVLNARVMACRDIVATEARGQPVERGELQAAIAGHAGDRRFAIQIARDERLDNIALEVAFEVKYIKGKARSRATPTRS